MEKSTKVLLLVLSLALVSTMMMFSGCSSSSSSSTPAPAFTGYTATLYMASEAGGHVGVYPVTIDPTNTTSPITLDVSNVKKIQLQGSFTSANKVVFHDVRLDGTKLYYSAFFSSTTNSTIAHLGYVDLTQANSAATNNSIDSTIDIDAMAADTIAFALDAMFGITGKTLKAVYCGSGMTATHYIPMTMSFPAYIDAFPKTAIATANSHVTATTTGFKRTYIDSIDADAAGWTRMAGGDLGTPPLAFLHGNSSPDGTKLFVSTNVVSGLTTTNNLKGVFRAYLLNTSDITSGTMTPSKVISKGSYTVAPTLASIAYRGAFTPDGTKYLQSGSDRMLIIDTTSPTLALYNDTNNDAVKIGGGKTGIENHDVMVTPDGKYAILAVRYFDSAAATVKTSGVQLYDINNKKFIGGMVSTCGAAAGACHVAAGDATARPTCGLVGKFN